MYRNFGSCLEDTMYSTPVFAPRDLETRDASLGNLVLYFYVLFIFQDLFFFDKVVVLFTSFQQRRWTPPQIGPPGSKRRPAFSRYSTGWKCEHQAIARLTASHPSRPNPRRIHVKIIPGSKRHVGDFQCLLHVMSLRNCGFPIYGPKSQE